MNEYLLRTSKYEESTDNKAILEKGCLPTEVNAFKTAVDQALPFNKPSEFCFQQCIYKWPIALSRFISSLMQDINFSNKAPVMKFHCEPVCGRQRCFPDLYSGFQKTADKLHRRGPLQESTPAQGSDGTRAENSGVCNQVTDSGLQLQDGVEPFKSIAVGAPCHNTIRDKCDTWNQSDVPKNTVTLWTEIYTKKEKAVTFLPHAHVLGWAWKTRLSLKRGGMSQAHEQPYHLVLTGSVSQHSIIDSILNSHSKHTGSFL